MELPRLISLWDEFDGHGIQFVGVNTGDSHTWMTDLCLDFSAIDDPSQTILWSYAESSFTYPLIYIIGRDMVITANTTALQTESFLRGLIWDAVYMRDPIDVEMIMDVSDSMNDPSPSDPGGDSKLFMMKQATTMITDFLNDHGQVDDRMGLVWFTDDASEYINPEDDKLLPVQIHWADLRGQINAHGTGTCTAMGAGLQMAFDTLSASTEKRFAILCTDGMQNIEPKVTEVGGDYQIIDSGGYLCGGHSSVPPQPGVSITSYDTCIHTIGVGITATYASLLQEIANATGGFYRGTDDPETDLALIYFLDLCNCMAGGSPAVVHHSTGVFYPEECQVVERFCLNRSARKITVMLSWKKSQESRMTFWLYGPDGTLLDLHQEMKLYENHCLATIYLPRQQGGIELAYIGEWQLVIRGESQGTNVDYHAFVIAEDREIKYVLDYPRKFYEVGDILPLEIKFTDKDEPITRVNEIIMETAQLRVPLPELLAQHKMSSYEMLRMIKAGPSKYQKDPCLVKIEALALDPCFKERLKPVRTQHSLQKGELECTIGEKELIVPVNLKQAGLHSFKVEIQCETLESGPICRTDMVTVNVGPGKADPKLSKISVMKISTKKKKGALIRIVPRNKYGNLLGPGHGHELKAKIGRKKLDIDVVDQLDGTYQIELPVPRPRKKAKRESVSITFGAWRVWKGEI